MSNWNGLSVPRLVSMVLCEDAATGVGDGHVTLQRLFFELYVDAFPAGYDRLVVANTWLNVSDQVHGPGDGPQFRESVRIVAPDGTVVGQADGTLALGSSPGLTHMFHFARLVLPAPGQYRVEVALGDAVVDTFPLWVWETKGANDEDQQEST